MKQKQIPINHKTDMDILSEQYMELKDREARVEKRRKAQAKRILETKFKDDWLSFVSELIVFTLISVFIGYIWIHIIFILIKITYG